MITKRLSDDSSEIAMCEEEIWEKAGFGAGGRCKMEWSVGVGEWYPRVRCIGSKRVKEVSFSPSTTWHVEVQCKERNGRGPSGPIGANANACLIEAVGEADTVILFEELLKTVVKRYGCNRRNDERHVSMRVESMRDIQWYNYQ